MEREKSMAFLSFLLEVDKSLALELPEAMVHCTCHCTCETERNKTFPCKL